MYLALINHLQCVTLPLHRETHYGQLLGFTWAINGDLWISSVFNVSLVSNSTNFVGDSFIELFYSVYPFTAASIVIHDHFRGNISINSTLFHSYTTTSQHQLYTLFLNYGSNRIANISMGVHWAIPSFSFDDVCGQPKPLQLTVHPNTACFHTHNFVRVVLR
ncbi:hypothetical protein THRCLA_05288 [Thraustotheca clavata]|uniref:Uncharacterized protein n=1 Tax=Thraustotheca clavata TaxID=74557 RepID=A0A1V9ZWH8_9STRA|nr:hypothetical protein THRCLA_05288 [Thraustotheca clavata]